MDLFIWWIKTPCIIQILWQSLSCHLKLNEQGHSTSWLWLNVSQEPSTLIKKYLGFALSRDVTSSSNLYFCNAVAYLCLKFRYVHLPLHIHTWELTSITTDLSLGISACSKAPQRSERVAHSPLTPTVSRLQVYFSYLSDWNAKMTVKCWNHLIAT